MGKQGVQFPVAALACSLLLAGCNSLLTSGEWPGSASVAATDVDAAAAGAPLLPVVETAPGGVVVGDPNDDLNLGKRHFREQNFGLAEKHFRRAVEAGRLPAGRGGEAWLGLAAAYDKLRRFELADRAYQQAIKIAGPTPEILNNQGYSYLLRGDYARARKTLAEAQARDPDNPHIRNNIRLLERSRG
jgi:Flp pilus assembly protein TadD